MAPPNRKNAGKNWSALKTEMSKTQTKSSTVVTKTVQFTQRMSKKKRKDQRQTIKQEAIRLLSEDSVEVDKMIIDEEPIFTKGTTPKQIAHAVDEVAATIRSASSFSVVGLDCEYVGVGFHGAEDQVARVSVVNDKGEPIYDKYVKPLEEVTDFRTHVSGVQPGHLINGVSFAQVQQEVSHLLQNKIVVGHALQNDFRVLKLAHPFRLTRDTSKYKPFRTTVNSTGAPSLRLLAERLLGVRIQTGEHSSVIDARTALRLYMLNRKKWDAQIKQSKKHRFK